MTQEALRMAHKALIGLSIKHGEMTDEGMDAITAIEKALAKEKALQALHSENERLGLYKDAYAEQEQEPLEKFCDSNCVWTDHHPDCKLAQPQQEPVAHWSDCAVHSEPAYPKGECDCGGFATSPQRTEQNFCSRCGKRLGGINSIHTCTPPMEKNT